MIIGSAGVFDDAKEGLRLCSLEVVGEKVWIRQV